MAITREGFPLCLEIQDYLLTHTLDQLEAEHGVKSRVDGHKVSLNYSQIDARDSDPLSQECRGLVVTPSDNRVLSKDEVVGPVSVLARTMLRFFNYGQEAAAPVDFDDPNTVVYEKLDGCFLYNTKVNCWDGSTVKIGDIVTKGLNPTLLGMDKNGNLIPTRVTKRFNNGTKDKWMELTLSCVVRNGYSSGRWPNKLKITPNHEIHINGDFQPAFKAKPGDVVVNWSIEPDEIVLRLIQASMLGDGCVVTNGRRGSRYEEAHSNSQEEYLVWKNQFLGECARSIQPFVSGFGSEGKRLTSKTYSSLNEMREIWYPEGKKVVPSDLSWLDDFAVAVWFMDDGSRSTSTKQRDRAVFSTNNFSKADCLRLARKLELLYSVSTTVFYSKGWNVRINSGRFGEIDRFWEAMSPYIIPSMEYKIPEKFRTGLGGFHHQGTETRKRQEATIQNVCFLENTKKNFPHGRCGFDIETTSHNYFVNGICVHNSLCIVYFDSVMGKWCVATRSVPNADLPVDGFEKWTFSSLFWHSLVSCSSNEVVREMARVGDLPLGRDFTYCFELCTPENEVVVSHNDYSVTLLSVIRTADGRESLPEETAALLGIRSPEVHRINSVVELIDWVSRRDPTSYEGVVVCDPSFRRVKIKSPGYLAYNKIRDNIGKSPKALLEVILLEKLDDVSVMLTPNQKALADKYLDSYRALCKRVDTDLSEVLDRVNEVNESYSYDFGSREHRKLYALTLQERGGWMGPMMFFYVKMEKTGKLLKFADWVESNKDPKHGWSNTFLETVLKEMGI